MFVTGGKTYLVRAVGKWTRGVAAMSPRFELRATTTFSTYRNPDADVNGKIGEAGVNLSDEKCLPLMPADSRVMDRAGIRGDAMGGIGSILVAYTGDGLEILLYEKGASA